MVLYVLTGLPGLAKTARAMELVGKHHAILLSRDELRAAYRNAIDANHLSELMVEQARCLLTQGYHVVIDCWDDSVWEENLWYVVAADTNSVIQWLHINVPAL